MSIETWMAEFYPVQAKDCPKEQAVAHSIRKWEGLRKPELVRHRLHLDGAVIYDNGDIVFRVNDSTCALCIHYFDEEVIDDPSRRCKRCPLAQVRGGVPCDCIMEGEPCSPFLQMYDKRDPEPMIHWLKQIKE